VSGPDHLRLRRAWRLSRGGLALPELLWTYARVRLDLRQRSLHELSTRPPTPRRGGSRLDQARVSELRELCDAVLGRPPFRSRCLVRALVLRQLLGRRGTASQLVITVARVDGGVGAHAETRLPTNNDPAQVLLVPAGGVMPAVDGTASDLSSSAV
jgi:transglutaminase superfamily protein